MIALVAGAVLNPLLLVVVLAMWIRSALSAWHPEWPIEFPGVVPDRVASDTGGATRGGTRSARPRPRRRS